MVSMARALQLTGLLLCGSLLGLSASLVGCGGHNVSCDAEQSARASTVLGLGVDAAAGADVFANTCGGGGCHGSDGISGPAPDLDEHASHFDSEGLACLLLAGTGNMPSQAKLSDQQLADVLAYVEETFL